MKSKQLLKYSFKIWNALQMHTSFWQGLWWINLTEINAVNSRRWRTLTTHHKKVRSTELYQADVCKRETQLQKSLSNQRETQQINAQDDFNDYIMQK